MKGKKIYILLFAKMSSSTGDVDKSEKIRKCFSYKNDDYPLENRSKIL